MALDADMLDAIQRGFRRATNRLRGFEELTESNIDAALRDIRTSLLEADVEYGVVQAFLDRVRDKALGEVVRVRARAHNEGGEVVEVTPADHFIKICYDELEALMGPAPEEPIRFASSGVTKLMLVGLQGSGKTTTAGKLAHLLREEYGRTPALAAADIYRPAAVDQLRVLGERLGVPVYHREGASPPDLCAEAVDFAREQGCDVVIFDTAGRLAIDEPLMAELETIQARTKPDDIFFVVDAMTGQDAARTARAFDERLSFDGVILTKLDGDARGGAALSIRHVTGKPIVFVGMGEGLDRLEPFRPDGMASRILGYGDVVGLMRDFERVVDEEKAEQDAEKILKGQFNFDDFVEQLRTIRRLGPVRDVLEKLPFFEELVPEGAVIDEQSFGRVEAMIQSMTRQERADPDILDASRMRRVARGSGTSVEEVAGLLERFRAMRSMMRMVGSKPSLLSRIPGFRRLAQLQHLQGVDMGEMFGAGGDGSDGDLDITPEMAEEMPRSVLRHYAMLRRAGHPVPPAVERELARRRKGRTSLADTVRADPGRKRKRRKDKKRKGKRGGKGKRR